MDRTEEETLALSPFKILHVLGSPTSDWCFELSKLYGGAFDKNLGNGKYDHVYAVIRPDQKWSFVNDLSKLMSDKEFFEEIEASVGKMEITSALSHIKNVLKPDAAVVHLVCEKGNTIYRALLEALEIPLIGGRSESRFISCDKIKTRNCVSAEVLCPDAIICEKGDEVKADEISYPCVVKSSRGDDSLGVRLVKSSSFLKEAIENALHYADTFLIERFIRGREIRTGVIKSAATGLLQALPCLEYQIEPDGIRLTQLKLACTNGLPTGIPPHAKSRFLDPLKEDKLIKRIQEQSLKAFRMLGLEDFALFDFRIDEDENPWFLESNIFCSFSPESKLNMLAKHSGMSDEELFVMMLENALLRQRKSVPSFTDDL